MLLEHKENMSKTVIFSEEGMWTVELEVVDNHPFAHLSVDNPNVKSLRGLLNKMRDLRYFLGCVGYPYIFGAMPKDNKKVLRYYGMLGLKVIAETDDSTILVLETGMDE